MLAAVAVSRPALAVAVVRGVGPACGVGVVVRERRGRQQPRENVTRPLAVVTLAAEVRLELPRQRVDEVLAVAHRVGQAFQQVGLAVQARQQLVQVGLLEVRQVEQVRADGIKVAEVERVGRSKVRGRDEGGRGGRR